MGCRCSAAAGARGAFPLVKPRVLLLGVLGAIIVAKIFTWRFKKSSRRGDARRGVKRVRVDNCSQVPNAESPLVTQQDWQELGTDQAPFVDPEAPRDDADAVLPAKVLAEKQFDAEPLRVLAGLFNPASGFWVVWQQQSNYTDVQLGSWRKHESKGSVRWVREISYCRPLNPVVTMGARQASCIETHTMHYASSTGWRVSIEAITPNVPFGKAFHCSLLLSGRPIATDDSSNGGSGCHMEVRAAIIFRQRILLSEGLVRRSALNEMGNTYRQLLQLLQEQVSAQLEDHKLAMQPRLPPRTRAHTSRQRVRVRASVVQEPSEVVEAEEQVGACECMQQNSRSRERLQVLCAALILFLAMMALEGSVVKRVIRSVRGVLEGNVAMLQTDMS